MKTLFISGNENSGKTTICSRLKQKLSNKDGNYEVLEQILNELPNSEANPHDYILVLKEKKSNINQRIILNYAADSVKIIQNFIQVLERVANEKDVGFDNIILITAARNEDDEMRFNLQTELKKVYPDFNPDDIVEIPLARINGNSDTKLLEWYLTSIKELIVHILSNNPFNLIFTKKSNR